MKAARRRGLRTWRSDCDVEVTVIPRSFTRGEATGKREVRDEGQVFEKRLVC